MEGNTYSLMCNKCMLILIPEKVKERQAEDKGSAMEETETPTENSAEHNATPEEPKLKPETESRHKL